MKRLLLIVITAMISLSVSAVTGLRIDKIFDGQYQNDPDVTLTLMSGENSFLKRYKLTTLRFLMPRQSKYASKIVPLIIADGANAIGKKISYENGKLHYAFYSLPPKIVNRKEVKRYICYLDGPKNSLESVMLLYMEGDIFPEQANRLFKSM